MIPDFELPTLTKKNINGKRHYVTPEGMFYPSITTVLAFDPEKEKKLKEWHERIGEKKARKITKQAAKRGTSMHLMCERYIDCEENYERDAMPDALQMFHSIKPWIDETEEVWIQESQMYSDYLRTGGRVDLIGRWRGVPSVIDFKQSNKFKKKEWIFNYFMQTAAYAVMFEELTGIPIPQLVIIMAVKDSKPLLFVEKRDEYIFDYIKLRDFYEKYHPLNYK